MAISGFDNCRQSHTRYKPSLYGAGGQAKTPSSAILIRNLANFGGGKAKEIGLAMSERKSF